MDDTTQSFYELRDLIYQAIVDAKRLEEPRSVASRELELTVTRLEESLLWAMKALDLVTQ